MFRTLLTFFVRLALVTAAAPVLAAPPAKTAPAKPPAASPAKASPAVAAPAVQATAATATAVSPASSAASEADTLYAVGLAISRNLGAFNLTESELKTVQEGLADGVLGKKPRVALEAAMPMVQTLLAARMKAVADAEKKAGGEYLEKAAAEPGAKKMPSGFVYKEAKAGTGVSPGPTDSVTVHYTGRLTDGTVFDSSVERNEPATFALNQVVPCWSQGIPLMKAGGKAQLVCPSELAYGERGAPPKIKGGATLVFDVELISVGKKPEAPAAVATPAPVTK